MRPLVILLGAALLAPAATTRLAVTVVDQKTGAPVLDLKPGDFKVSDSRSARPVESATYTEGPVDVLLLLDTSLIGGAVQGVAGEIIDQLGEKEQMAVVSFHSAADLIQDFTQSKERLRRAVASVQYGNSPRVLDALYAALDGGFENASFRRVLLLVTTGVDGSSRVSEREVVQLARHNGVSIYPVYVMGYGRSLFESLARQTGGASFNLHDMGKSKEPVGRRIFQVIRGYYILQLQSGLQSGDKLKVEVRTGRKVAVSALPIE